MQIILNIKIDFLSQYILHYRLKNKIYQLIYGRLKSLSFPLGAEIPLCI